MSDEKNELKDYVSKKLNSHSLWTKLWSFAHHGFLFGAAILSASAAIILKVIPDLSTISSENLAAIFASIAALMSTIGGLGGFQRKWQTNRRTKSSLEKLQIELMSDQVDTPKIRSSLQETIVKHHEGIIGEA